MARDRSRQAGWARLAPMYWLDPKIIKAGAEGEVMFLRGMSWSKYHGLDGAIDRDALPVLGMGLTTHHESLAARELDIGLWVPLDDGRLGIDLARWRRHQETEARRQEKAELGRLRQERYRAQLAEANGHTQPDPGEETA